LNGTRHAVAAGWQVLEKGGSALDAAEEPSS
jgi:isoaspartyl peptidase/L-asparaginase-like protein (Ntn-hydrolase superfamily)